MLKKNNRSFFQGVIMSTTTLTPSELSQVEAANASGKQPVVLVHGLWLLASSWDAWRAPLEAAGYAPVAVDWPHDSADVASARADDQALAGTSVADVADHVTAVAQALDTPPVLIGHSFGGLLVQMVAGRGVAAATVSIDPAPSRGVLPLPFSALKAAFPVLGNPANRGRSVTLTFDQFRYGFANAVPEQEARELYEAHHVAAPGRPLFQAAFANVWPATVVKADKKNPARGPMLVVSGGADNIVPPVMSRATFRGQKRNAAVTDFVEIDGAGHSLVIDSRRDEVIAASLDFLAKHV